MSEPLTDEAVEETVKRFSKKGWSTRRIARQLNLSQSKVMRILQKSRRRWLPRPTVLQAALLAIAAGLLAIAAAILVSALIPASKPPLVVICVRYAPAGAVTALAAPGDNTCSPGWETLTLTPGS